MVVGLMVSSITGSVFAYHENDDKNNPQLPGCAPVNQGFDCQSPQALDNHQDNCEKHIHELETRHLPAQCN